MIYFSKNGLSTKSTKRTEKSISDVRKKRYDRRMEKRDFMNEISDFYNN